MLVRLGLADRGHAANETDHHANQGEYEKNANGYGGTLEPTIFVDDCHADQYKVVSLMKRSRVYEDLGSLSGVLLDYLEYKIDGIWS